MKAISRTKRHWMDPAIGIVSGLVILLIIVGFFISDRFGTIQNLTNILENSVSLGLSSLGQTLVVLTGGIDLSIGGVINLTDYMTGEGAIYTNPYLDLGDFLNLEFGQDYEGNQLQLPDQPLRRQRTPALLDRHPPDAAFPQQRPQPRSLAASPWCRPGSAHD